MYLVAECPKCNSTQGIFTKKSVDDAILYCKVCEKRSKLTKERGTDAYIWYAGYDVGTSIELLKKLKMMRKK